MNIKLLTTKELKLINRKPLESELPLKLLLNYYEEFLTERTFAFELDYPTNPLINLRFEKDNLCHLLGFQHIFEDEPDATSYSGASGCDLINSGTITMDTFKKPHIRPKYKEGREWILYFAYIYQLLKNSTVLLFSNEHFSLKYQRNLYSMIIGITDIYI